MEKNAISDSLRYEAAVAGSRNKDVYRQHTVKSRRSPTPASNASPGEESGKPRLSAPARRPRTEILGGMTIHRFCGPRGLCPQTPSRGLAAPCTPAVLLTVSPRGTPPRPPAYVGVPQVGVGVVGVAVDLKRRKDERRLTESRGGTRGGWSRVAEGRTKVDRESWR